MEPGRKRSAYLHLIHLDDDVQDLAASSKLNAEWEYLRLLFDRGRRWADTWLASNFDAIGARSTFDLDELFEAEAAPGGHAAAGGRGRRPAQPPAPPWAG